MSNIMDLYFYLQLATELAEAIVGHDYAIGEEESELMKELYELLDKINILRNEAMPLSFAGKPVRIIEILKRRSLQWRFLNIYVK